MGKSDLFDSDKLAAQPHMRVLETMTADGLSAFQHFIAQANVDRIYLRDLRRVRLLVDGMITFHRRSISVYRTKAALSLFVSGNTQRTLSHLWPLHASHGQMLPSERAI